MADKTNKLKARLPRGLADRGPAEIAATRRMTDAIRDVYERYGFEPVETPAIEYTDALGKFLPDQDRPNEGVFSFQDDDEQWLSLRYDLTAPLARYVAENFDALPKPYRSYRFGWVFRNEKPGPGRFRQFMQFDADTVGSASPAADAEICMMAADTMEALGLKGQYVVKVNNRKVLDGVLEAIGLGGEANAGKRLTVLRAIDKLDRLGAGGVNQLLGEGRKDESGDFTKGAGLDAGAIDRVLSFVEFERRERRSNAGQSCEGGCGLDAGRSRCRRAAPDFQFDDVVRLWRRSHPDRSLRRARPRILHRPGLRGGASARDQGREGPSGAFRFRRRRRPLRRIGVAVPRRAGAGDRVLDRRVAVAGGAHHDRQARRQGRRPARWW